MKDIRELLDKLAKVKQLSTGGYVALCPAHKELKQSLSLAQKDGKILIHCFVGCSAESIVTALGLSMSDLFIESFPVTGSTLITPKEDKVYDYQDEKGNVLYQVVRMVPKDFRQRHKNGEGNWVWSTEGIRKVPYHLPEIIKIHDETIYIVEGEKDADSLWDWGCIATTNAGGSNNWSSEFSNYFLNKKVVLIPHRDNPGREYCKIVAKSLEGKAREIKCVLLDAGKDISDWFELDGDVALLPSMEQPIEILFASDKPAYRQVDEAIQWDKKVDDLLLTFRAEKVSEERTGVHARVSIYGQHESLSWSYLNIERAEERIRIANASQAILKSGAKYSKDDMRRDLDNFCAGLWEFYLSRFAPEEMEGDETPQALSCLLNPYLVEKGGTIIFAPPGRGKSYTALLWVVSVDAGCNKFWVTHQKRALFINLERSRESFKRRLSMVNKVLGLPPTRPLLTINARGKSLSDIIPSCRKAILKYNVELIALDSISRSGLGDLNENLSGNRVIDALSALCPTWLAMGHTSRATEDHLYGSVMFDAGADICVQLSSQVKDDGTLGVGWQITKQNDTGYTGQKVYAFEFKDNILANFRLAKPYEFPDIVGKVSVDMLTAIIDYVTNLDTADATASEIEKELGYDRANVSRLFNQSGKFQQTRKVKQSIYYGVKV